MLSWIIIFLIFVTFFIAFLLLRTLSLHKRNEPVEQIDVLDIDSDKTARHLSAAIHCKTVSVPGLTDKERGAWLEFRNILKKHYPDLHKTLKCKVFNQYSLLYTWPGKDSHLEPILFSSHMDVVPVDKDTEKEWNVSPYEGIIKDGFVWGRGALDLKSQITTLMDAVELLIKRGYTPKRTIYLAIGHDEEISGLDGAHRIAQWLKEQHIHLAALLDEGGHVSQGLLPGIGFPIALVSLAEKGYLTLNLTVRMQPGHSSAPLRQTAIGVIARAIALVDDHPSSAKLTDIQTLLNKIGYALPFTWQVMIANSWLFGGMIKKQLERVPQLNALIRTTSAATVITGGVKDNILPAQAQAKVNFRMMPGDSMQKITERVKKIIGDPRIQYHVEKNEGWEASAFAPIETPAFRTLELVIKQIFGDIPVAPIIFRGATDARHYQEVCGNIYRFTPQLITSEDAPRIHGINERISIDNLKRMVNFFSRLIQVWGEAEF